MSKRKRTVDESNGDRKVNGAESNNSNIRKDTSLWRAVQSNRWDDCRSLLQQDTASFLVEDQRGGTILGYACRKTAPLDVVEAVYRKFPRLTTEDYRDYQRGHDYLVRIVRYASDEVASFVIEECPPSCFDEVGVFIAIIHKRWEVIRLLLRKECALRLVQHKDSFLASSTLGFAIMYNAPLDVLEDIHRTDGTQIAMQDVHGITPLFRACGGGLSRVRSEEVVKFVLREAPQTAATKNKHGKTPLLTALGGGGSEEVVKILLREAPQTAAIKSSHGEFPLQLAAGNMMSLSILRTLLALQPTAARAVNKEGRTPFTSYANALYESLSEYERSPHWSEHTRSLYLLQAAYLNGTVDVLSCEDDDGNEDSKLWLHTIIKHSPDTRIPSLQVRYFVRCAVRTECARTDAGRNFPLHLACAQPAVPKVKVINGWTTRMW